MVSRTVKSCIAFFLSFHFILFYINVGDFIKTSKELQQKKRYYHVLGSSGGLYWNIYYIY